MQGTNQTLLNIHRETQQLQTTLTGLFLKSKIKQFYTDNSIRIETILGKMQKLQSEFFVIENEKIKTEGEDAQPVLKEGKDKKEFDDKFDALMKEEVNIKI